VHGPAVPVKAGLRQKAHDLLLIFTVKTSFGLSIVLMFFAHAGSEKNYK
jgi:hypothetical protein